MMEYQFIKDPILGFQVRLSDEHALVGRWLNDEVSKDSLKELITLLSALPHSHNEFQKTGSEVRATINKDEAIFEAHALFHDAQEDLTSFEEDLFLDEAGLVAACGYEDLMCLLTAWLQFIENR